MKTYLKPLTVKAKFKDDICDDMCGIIGSWAVSTGSGNEFQICVHFPQTTTTGHGYNQQTITYYSSGGGDQYVRKVKITGQHTVTFEGAESGVDCTYSKNDGYTYGCGWQRYTTSGNGNCHYFGIIKVDGIQITRYGDLPSGCTEGW